MKNADYFDVLTFTDDLESVDMIQAIFSNECLGTFFNNSTAKLYFNSGLREVIEIKLEKLFRGKTIKWIWKTQVYEDWHLAWQDHFKPVLIDNQLAVIPHWKKDHPAEITIIIKPGMAFGTGHHETTWLMLSQMLKYMKFGMSVLDLGTGSGILSIAAIKLGADKIDSVENDIECAANFHENLGLNEIQDGIQYHNEDVLRWDRFNYDLTLANINRNVIEDLIPVLQISKGTILLSGLLETDYDPINKLCLKHNLQIKENIGKGEWICLAVE